MLVSDIKSKTFEAALSAVAASNHAKARKLFQKGAVNGRYLSLESCDFLRGVAMCEYLERQDTSNLAVIRVAKSISSYGAYSMASEQAKTFAPEHPTAFPLAGYYSDDTTGMAYTIIMTTPGRWLAAAALAETEAGNYAQAESYIAQAYREDKIEPGKHLIVDTARALNFMAAKRWTDALTVASMHASYTEGDWDTYENASSVQGPPAYSSVAVCNAVIATAQAHLANYDAALAGARALINSEYTPAVVVSQAYYVMGMVYRLTSQPESEVSEALGNAAAACAKRRDIADALNDSSKTFRITSEEMINGRTDYWDESTEPSLSAASAAAAEEKRNVIVEQAMAELNRMIGMDSVKRQVDNLRRSVEYNKSVAAAGGNAHTANINYTFQGPPGVGKTSVARIVGRILYGLGVVESDKFVETIRNDLVGQYQGQTGARTQEKLNEARGGTFFLDEAYALVNSENDSFGQEAMDTIVPFMSNERGNTCVIFAGYRGDMQRLLGTNEGLSSRFSQHIIFDSYSPSELADICVVVAEGRGKILPANVRDIIEKTLVSRVIDSDTGQSVIAPDGKSLIDKMGNARGSTNIVEACESQIQSRLSTRGSLAGLSLEVLTTITEEDAVAATNEIIDRVLVA